MKLKIYAVLLLFCLAGLLSGQVTGTLDQIGDKKILHVWGDHYQRGYAQGYLLTPQIMEVFNDFYWTMFCFSNADFYNLLWNYYMEHFNTEQRMYMEAMGMAEGMAQSGNSIYHNGLGRNLGTDDLLMLNAAFDMVMVRSSKSGKNDLQLGCASLSSWGTATAADTLLTGSGVITRFFDATQNSAFINNPIMVVHNPTEEDEGKWLNFTFPGWFGSLTAISESNVFASMNVVGDSYAANPTGLSTLLFDVRRGIERLDYDQNGSANALDILAAIAAGNHLSGASIHTIAENSGNVYSSVVETRYGATQNRLYNQNGNLPTHHLAATNHFRVLSSPVCCTRYSNIQDSLYANPNITAKRQWRVLSGAAGLETTLSAIQFVPSTGALLWASATNSEPAYAVPALSINITDLFSFPVANSDDLAPAASHRIRAYPNPLGIGKQLSIVTGESLESLEVYNLRGQKVLSCKLEAKMGTTTIPLDWDFLARGIYLLRAKTTSGLLRSGKVVLR
jgi:hypothetical protein